MKKRELILNGRPILADNRRITRLALISLILLLNVAGFFYFIYYLRNYDYLPSPFIYDKSDTFMDLFNVLYWAYDEGRYIEWGAVYPPLNFLIIKGLNFLLMGEYGDPASMRENSQAVIFGFLLLYITIPLSILRLKQWKNFSSTEITLLYFSIILSAPFLFLLERGNLIILCPLVLALAISTIGFSRSFFIAILINLKPYFAILVLYYMMRRNWRGFITCTMLSGVVFLISGLALDGNFLVFFQNILSFSKVETLFSLREVLAFPSSISAFSYVLRHPDGIAIAAETLDPQSIEYLVSFIEGIKWSILSFSIGVLAAKARLLRDVEIFIVLVVAICNFGIWVGGYTFILYATLIPALIQMENKRSYLACLILLSIPLDLIVILTDYIGRQYSYFSTESIDVVWQLGAGSFLRPVINLMFLLILSYELMMRGQKSTPMKSQATSTASPGIFDK